MQIHKLTNNKTVCHLIIMDNMYVVYVLKPKDVAVIAAAGHKVCEDQFVLTKLQRPDQFIQPAALNKQFTPAGIRCQDCKGPYEVGCWLTCSPT